MENGVIVKLSNLEERYIEQTVALLVDSFYDMFKGISKERKVLYSLFISSVQLDLFYALIQDNQVTGFVAVSDSSRRAIMIDKDACISIFGSMKGKIMAWQLRIILSKPAVKEKNQGYIDFVATASEFKRCGVASGLLTYIEQNTDFKWLYLDVLTSNHSAICLYKKLGYVVDAVKKNVLMSIAGIKPMKIMKKELK